VVWPGALWSKFVRNFLRSRKMGEIFHGYGMAAAKSAKSVVNRLSSSAKLSDSPVE
jgi:hypothetical protein